jgi:hypothetical protein
VIATCADPIQYRGDPRELLGAPGGLVELDGDGAFVREVPAADPSARHLILAPSGATVVGRADRLVTTNAGHGYTGTTLGERMPGISVQIWKLSNLELLHRRAQAGPRGGEPRSGHGARAAERRDGVRRHRPGRGAVRLGLGRHVEPAFKLVFDFGAGALAGDAVVTPDDRFIVVALAGLNRVAALDIGDRWHPKLASAVRFDRDPLDPAKARRGGRTASR